MAGRRRQPNDMLSAADVLAQYDIPRVTFFERKAKLLKAYYAPERPPKYIPRWQVEYLLCHTREVLPPGATRESVAA